jgi:hypothetical protein
MIPIALGIGINTGIFAILSNVALRPLPTPDSTALVTVHQDFQGVKGRRVHGARSMFSVPEYETYRDTTKTLSGIMAYTMAWTFTLGGKAPQEIEGVLVTCNYFDVLRVRPSIGTGFTQANCAAPNAAPSVVLSHALWTRAFDADPDIVRKGRNRLHESGVLCLDRAPAGLSQEPAAQLVDDGRAPGRWVRNR